MKIICVFASVMLVASGYRVAPTYDQPKLVECGGWDGYFEVVYPQISGPETIVTSSNYGNSDYSDNERCSVQFITEEQPITFQLTFADFQVEEGYDCNWDSFCVRGVEYCNETLNGKILSYTVPANSTFTLAFKSDSSITRRGYKVIVNAVPGESREDDLDYEDLCLNYYDESAPTAIVEPFFPEYTDYPNNWPEYDYRSNDYDNVACDTGNNDNDYNTEDYNYGNYDGDNYGNYDGNNYDDNNYENYN